MGHGQIGEPVSLPAVPESDRGKTFMSDAEFARTFVPPVPPRGGAGRDPLDPPILLLQTSTAYAPWLPDGVWQRVPMGSTGQVLTALANGSAGWAAVPGTSGGLTPTVFPSGDTTGATDTLAIQGAMDTIWHAHGGICLLATGVYYITQLVLRNGVLLWGQGQGEIFPDAQTGLTNGTILRAPLGSTTHMIVPDPTPPYIASPGLLNLTLDGNNGSNLLSPNQTPNAFDGIHFVTKVTRFTIQNVTIINVPNDAIHLDGNVSFGGSFFNNISIENPYNNGVSFGASTGAQDTTFIGVIVNGPGLNCFLVNGTEGQFIGCKSNLAGVLATGSTVNYGFLVEGETCTLSGCTSENDNGANGLACGFGVTGNRNNLHISASGSGQALLYLSGGAVYNNIDLGAGSQTNTGPSNYIYQIDGVTTKNNKVVVKGNPTVNTAYSLLTNAGSEQNNAFECENESPMASQALTFAATVTPDPFLGGNVQLGTITTAVTINNPANGHVGSRITFRLLQNVAGGNAVTFGSAYKTSGAIPTTGSTGTEIGFTLDSSGVWRETFRATA